MAVHSCDHCRDRIGVWEPAVFVAGGAYATTQAARPDLAAEATERYHATATTACSSGRRRIAGNFDSWSRKRSRYSPQQGVILWLGGG
jgi:hypothetical protein